VGKAVNLLFALDELNDLKSAWGKRDYLHLKSRTNNLSKVFGWDQLNNTLNGLRLPHSSLSLFKGGRAIQYHDALDVIRETQNGATLILEDIDNYDPGLREFLDSFSHEVNNPARLNLYLSYPDEQGYLRHYDTHDFLILQISGKKKWNIYQEKADSPLYYQKTHEEYSGQEPGLSDELILSEGEILYVRKGQWHEAVAVDGPSLHLTLAVFSRTGIDFLEWLVEELRDNAKFRQSFPLEIKDERDFTNNLQSNNYDEFIDEMAQDFGRVIKEPDLGMRFLKYNVATRFNRNRFSYPCHLEEASDDFFKANAFYLSDKTFAVFPESENQSFEILGSGLCFRFSRELLPLVREILEERHFRPGDHCKNSEYEREDVISLARALYKFGFLYKK